jgi:indolepyruvate ferredoxin oxidoreductase alpha subunit
LTEETITYSLLKIRSLQEQVKRLLMGNEAIALGAIRAGVQVVTGYPGTPSTEILETVAREAAVPGSRASQIYDEWSVNEKSALEVGAGAAAAGARVLVTMKQVGLNVASDPLMSLNYLGVSGALVLAVADDPGPISSQTEQDTRRFGLYAKIAVFDPSTPEEAYTMIAAAFDWSETYGRPVIVRPTTRVCHSYASVEILPDLPPKKPAGFERGGNRWVIFPSLTFKNHKKIEADLVRMGEEFSSIEPGGPGESGGNRLTAGGGAANGAGGGAAGGFPAAAPGAAGGPVLGIAAGGVSYAYAMEALSVLDKGSGGAARAEAPAYKLLKVGTFPFPQALALKFLDGLEEVLVLEELDPVIEDELVRLCGLRHRAVRIRGKRSADMPNAGEISPALAAEKIAGFLRRGALSGGFPAGGVPVAGGVPAGGPAAAPGAAGDFPAGGGPAAPGAAGGVQAGGFPAAAPGAKEAPPAGGFPAAPTAPALPLRPPVLCAGCPHRGSFFAVKEAVRTHGRGRKAVFSGDIGCYTLGNAQPLDMVDSCLCMGAGITMAQGINRVEPEILNFAFIGDSTFFHTGIPGIVNAVYNKANIIVVILDNYTTAMTGNQSHPGTGKTVRGEAAEKISIPALVSALGVTDLIRADPFNLHAAEAAVRAMLDKEGVRVIIFEGPCIAVGAAAQGAVKGSCVVDAAACTGCMACVKRLGCPAISIASKEAAPASGTRGLRARIDPVLCTGCGICKEVCAFAAIGDEGPAGTIAGGAP